MKPCKWCGLATPPAPDGVRTCGDSFTCTHRQAFDEGEEFGRADERAAIVAWLGKDVAPRSVAEDIAAAIERGEHEVKKPDQCTDCGAFIVGAHGCQGIPGDEES